MNLLVALGAAADTAGLLLISFEWYRSNSRLAVQLAQDSHAFAQILQINEIMRSRINVLSKRVTAIDKERKADLSKKAINKVQQKMGATVDLLDALLSGTDADERSEVLEELQELERQERASEREALAINRLFFGTGTAFILLGTAMQIAGALNVQ